MTKKKFTQFDTRAKKVSGQVEIDGSKVKDIVPSYLGEVGGNGSLVTYADGQRFHLTESPETVREGLLGSKPAEPRRTISDPSPFPDNPVDEEASNE